MNIVETPNGVRPRCAWPSRQLPRSAESPPFLRAGRSPSGLPFQGWGQSIALGEADFQGAAYVFGLDLDPPVFTAVPSALGVDASRIRRVLGCGL